MEGYYFFFLAVISLIIYFTTKKSTPNCPKGEIYNTMTGECECKPNCEKKKCGDGDGCGGKCQGQCGKDQTCINGECEYKIYRCSYGKCQSGYSRTPADNKNEYENESDCETSCPKVGDTVKIIGEFAHGDSGCLINIYQNNGMADVCSGIFSYDNTCTQGDHVNYTDIKKVKDKKIQCQDGSTNCEGITYGCQTTDNGQIPQFDNEPSCFDWLNKNNTTKWGKCINVQSEYDEKWTIGCNTDQDCDIGGDVIRRKCLPFNNPLRNGVKGTCSCVTSEDCTLPGIDSNQILCKATNLGYKKCPTTYP